MQTNQIPVTKLAPIYPSDHITVLRQRVSEAAPNIPLDERDVLLCDLYGINRISDLEDLESTISWPEYQPALSSEELHQMASRIKGLVGDTSENGTHALWVTRNILNCVPRTINDLKDYVLDDSLVAINMSFLLGTKHLEIPDLPEARFYDEAMKGRDDAEINIVGGIAMEHFQQKSVDSLECITYRQQVLSRAAEFYTLHRYGFTTGSLWLANFTNLIDFCCCPEPNCPGRHFGFLDVEGSAEIVLKAIPYIEKTIKESAKSISVPGHMPVDEIASSYVELTLYTAESLIMVDSGRADGNRCAKLLGFALKHQTLMNEINHIRLIRILHVFSDLYGDQVLKQVGMNRSVLEKAFEQSAFAFEELIKSLKSDDEPARKEMILYDSQNFLRAGGTILNWDYGMKLQAGFLNALYSPSHYNDFTTQVKALLEENKDLHKNVNALFESYLANIPGTIASKSLATWAFLDDLLYHGPHEKMMRILSEQGHLPSMKIRYHLAENDWEQDYWEKRIKAHPRVK